MNGKHFNKDTNKTSTQNINQDCKHSFTSKLVTHKTRFGDDTTRYRFCRFCGMKPHEDGRFSYACGHPYCRCSS
jgi:hypothetical protein